MALRRGAPPGPTPRSAGARAARPGPAGGDGPRVLLRGGRARARLLEPARGRRRRLDAGAFDERVHGIGFSDPLPRWLRRADGGPTTLGASRCRTAYPARRPPSPSRSPSECTPSPRAASPAATRPSYSAAVRWGWRWSPLRCGLGPRWPPTSRRHGGGWPRRSAPTSGRPAGRARHRGLAPDRRRPAAGDLRGRRRAGHARRCHADGPEGRPGPRGRRLHEADRSSRSSASARSSRSSSRSATTQEFVTRSVIAEGGRPRALCTPAPSRSTTCPRRSPTWQPRPHAKILVEQADDRLVPPTVAADATVHARRAAPPHRGQPDGQRVVFARSQAGDDPVNCLWVLDATPARSASSPIPVRCSPAPTSRAAGRGAGAPRTGPRRGPAASSPTPPTPTWWRPLALGGRCSWPAWCRPGARARRGRTGVRSPARPHRPAVAYVSGPALRVAELDGTQPQWPGDADDDDPDVPWGSAEFIAAEEMDRSRGYWWSPDGESVAVARGSTPRPCRVVDRRPGRPGRPPTEVAYPAAGTANADVTLHVVGLDGAGRRALGPPALPLPRRRRLAPPDRCCSSCSRATSAACVLAADPATGETTACCSRTRRRWVELVPARRWCSPDRWSPPPTATAPAACASTVSPSPRRPPGAPSSTPSRRQRRVHRQRGRRPDPSSTCGSADGEGPTGGTTEPGVHGPPPAGRRSWCARPPRIAG